MQLLPLLSQLLLLFNNEMKTQKAPRIKYGASSLTIEYGWKPKLAGPSLEGKYDALASGN